MNRNGKKANDLGDLIDMSQEMFESYIESKNLNLGMVTLLRQQLNAIYYDLYKKSELLVKKIQADSDQIEKNRDIDVLNRVYLVMQRVENRYFYLMNKEEAMQNALLDGDVESGN